MSMSGTQPKYPCNICGKLIGHAGFANYQHHQMHLREAKIVTDRLAEKESGTCYSCGNVRVLNHHSLCFECNENEVRTMLGT